MDEIRDNDKLIEQGTHDPGTEQPGDRGIFMQPEQSYLNKIRDNKTLFSTLKGLFYGVISVAGILVLLVLLLYLIPGIKEIPSIRKPATADLSELKKDPSYKKQITQLTRDVQRLTRKYSGYTSGQSYIVINTTDNLFYLYRNKKLIREGHCSTGSYKMLKTETGRSWIFKTPKGKFTIQGKTTNPYWNRPDWSFIEEGLPVPPKDDPSRFEYGVLGDYALSLGDGYLIHGTIYTRFLGLPVTHGCVRLNDDDLKAVFYNLNLGSKVYIF